MRTPSRIVSLLPSTTEIIFALGRGDAVVGVTFECDFPPAARGRTIVSTSAVPAGLDSAGIDAWVSAAQARGDDLYHLDEGALAGLDADLVVTQDLCAVCAVDVSVVDDALRHLGCSADVLTIDPHSLQEVLDSVLLLGERTGAPAEATSLVGSLRRRLADVGEAVAGRPRPRVVVLEWTDPPFAPGHWVPEMVTLAGGDPVLGRAGEKSYRVSWDDVRASRPEVVVCAPCGYDLAASAALAEKVVASGELPGVRVVAVDANASFARPGPRLVDGVETLAALLHGVGPQADRGPDGDGETWVSPHHRDRSLPRGRTPREGDNWGFDPRPPEGSGLADNGKPDIPLRPNPDALRGDK